MLMIHFVFSTLRMRLNYFLTNEYVSSKIDTTKCSQDHSEIGPGRIAIGPVVNLAFGRIDTTNFLSFQCVVV